MYTTLLVFPANGATRWPGQLSSRQLNIFEVLWLIVRPLHCSYWNIHCFGHFTEVLYTENRHFDIFTSLDRSWFNNFIMHSSSGPDYVTTMSRREVNIPALIRQTIVPDEKKRSLGRGRLSRLWGPVNQLTWLHLRPLRLSWPRGHEWKVNTIQTLSLWQFTLHTLRQSKPCKSHIVWLILSYKTRSFNRLVQVRA